MVSNYILLIPSGELEYQLKLYECTDDYFDEKRKTNPFQITYLLEHGHTDELGNNVSRPEEFRHDFPHRMRTKRLIIILKGPHSQISGLGRMVIG